MVILLSRQDFLGLTGVDYGTDFLNLNIFARYNGSTMIDCILINATIPNLTYGKHCLKTKTRNKLQTGRVHTHETKCHVHIYH